MSVRSWAVGVVSIAAVVAGVVAVQSGIAGTTALPVLPHRTATSSATDGGVDLPAPAEVSGPPPAAGAVRAVPAERVAAVVVPERRAAPAAHGPQKRSGHPAEPPKDKAGKGPGDSHGPDKHAGPEGPGEKPGGKAAKG